MPPLDSFAGKKPSLDSFSNPTVTPTVNHGGVALSVGSAGQSLMAGSLKQNLAKIPGDLTKAATKVTDALGFKGTVDTIGTNLARTNLHINPTADKSLLDSPVLKPTTVEQNVGAALQIGGTVGGLLAAPVTLPAAIGTSALVGGSMAGGQAMAENAPADEVLKRGGLGALIGGATAGIVGGIGKLLGKMGDKITTSVIRPTRSDLEDGFSLDTIKKYDLGGPLNKTFDKTQAQLGVLSTQLKEKLGAGTETVNLGNVYKETVAELTDSSKLKGFGANKKILNVLENLKEEVGIVGNDLAITDAQVVKQASGGFGAWQYGKQDPDSKASEIVFNTFYSKLKTAIEKASPEGVQAINAEMSKLIPVMNAVIRRLPVAERNNLISLSDMVGLVGSAHNPIALGPTLLNIISKSGTAGNALMKVAPKVSDAASKTALGANLIGQQVQQGSVPLQSPEQQQGATSPNASTKYGHLNPDGTMTVNSPFGGSDVILDPTIMGGGTVAKVGKEIVAAVAKKVAANPSYHEMIGAFLKQIDTHDINQILMNWDNFKPMLAKLGIDKLSPDKTLELLNKVMSKQ